MVMGAYPRYQRRKPTVVPRAVSRCVTMNEIWLAGVDGCRVGWVAAFVRADLSEARVRLVARFADVAAAPEAPAVIAGDMPIGLPERAGYGGRAAEDAVRPLPGARRASAFSGAAPPAPQAARHCR